MGALSSNWTAQSARSGADSALARCIYRTTYFLGGVLRFGEAQKDLCEHELTGWL